MASPMRHIAMAWIGPPLTGYGSAVCVKCGWSAAARNYGEVALSVLHHEHYGAN